MTESLQEYNDFIGEDYSYLYSTNDDIDSVLLEFIREFTNGECFDTRIAVAIYCNGKFIGFFLVCQEMTTKNYNIKLK